MKALASFFTVITAVTMLSMFTPTTVIAAHDYQAGYDQGFAEGYNRGYHDGIEGRHHHYHTPDGYDSYTHGLHDGRHAGYSTGYDDARHGRPNRFQQNYIPQPNIQQPQ